MSRIAAAGRSRVITIPGGMTAPPTSRAPSVRLVVYADHNRPAVSAMTEAMDMAASCGRVGRSAIGSLVASLPDAPCFGCFVAAISGFSHRHRLMACHSLMLSFDTVAAFAEGAYGTHSMLEALGHHPRVNGVGDQDPNHHGC